MLLSWKIYNANQGKASSLPCLKEQTKNSSKLLSQYFNIQVITHKQIFYLLFLGLLSMPLIFFHILYLFLCLFLSCLLFCMIQSTFSFNLFAVFAICVLKFHQLSYSLIDPFS